MRTRRRHLHHRCPASAYPSTDRLVRPDRRGPPERSTCRTAWTSSVSRFAEWAYINSDEAVHRGTQLARRLDGDARGLGGRRGGL